MQYKYRVVGFFSDQRSYPTSIASLKKAGENMANREDVRMAIVTDKILVKNSVRKFAKWFNGHTKNFILVANHKNEFKIFDVEQKEPT